MSGLNVNFHGGGIWMGTDQDHYARLGVFHNCVPAAAGRSASNCCARMKTAGRRRLPGRVTTS